MTVKLANRPMFGIQHKVWGWTQCLYLSEKEEIARAYMNKDWQCSRHCHKYKWNRFNVINGELEIIVYRNDREESIILKSGQTLDVEPGIYHRMISKTNVDLIEIYWVLEGILDPSDIVRVDNGSQVIKEEFVFKMEDYLPKPPEHWSIPSFTWPPIVDNEPKPYIVMYNALPDNL
jgi:mannose-6-phosphate isomerase-like protein (cupin superfamily)